MFGLIDPGSELIELIDEKLDGFLIEGGSRTGDQGFSQLDQLLGGREAQRGALSMGFDAGQRTGPLARGVGSRGKEFQDSHGYGLASKNFTKRSTIGNGRLKWDLSAG